MIDYAGHEILPSITLALIGFATFMRFTRSSMLETLKSDYVRTAKAKGLPGTQVIMRRPFRTALIPVTTVITISIAGIIEGAVITERVFVVEGHGFVCSSRSSNNVDPYPVMAAAGHLDRDHLHERDRRHHVRLSRPEDPSMSDPTSGHDPGRIPRSVAAPAGPACRSPGWTPKTSATPSGGVHRPVTNAVADDSTPVLPAPPGHGQPDRARSRWYSSPMSACPCGSTRTT